MQWTRCLDQSKCACIVFTTSCVCLSAGISKIQSNMSMKLHLRPWSTFLHQPTTVSTWIICGTGQGKLVYLFACLRSVDFLLLLSVHKFHATEIYGIWTNWWKQYERKREISFFFSLATQPIIFESFFKYFNTLCFSVHAPLQRIVIGSKNLITPFWLQVSLIFEHRKMDRSGFWGVVTYT